MRISVKAKIFLPLALTFTIISAILYFLVSYEVSRLSGEFISQIGRGKMDELSSSIASISRELQNSAALFTGHPAVFRAYETALAGNIDNEADPLGQEARVLLRTELGPMLQGYAGLRGELPRLHFHLPNGRSLARLWREKNIRRDGQWLDVSDDISGFRRTVVEVNRTGEPMLGLETGRIGVDVRGLLPVVSPAGRHLGSVEMQTEFEPVARTVAANDHEHLLFFVDTRLLDIASGLRDTERHPVLAGRHVRVFGTGLASLDDLVTAGLLDAAREELVVETQGRHALAAFPLADYSGDRIGVMVYILDITREQALIRAISLTVLGGLAVGLVVFVALGLLTTHKTVIGPLRRLRDFARTVTAGNLDQRLKLSTGDELQEVGEGMQHMVDKLNEQLAISDQRGQEALDKAHQCELATSEANEARQQAEAAKREGMLQAASSIDDVVARMTSASEELAAQVEEASRGAEIQRNRTGETAVAMEEMNATVLEVAKNASHAAEGSEQVRTRAQEGERIVTEAVEAINQVQTRAGTLKTSLGELGQQAEQIGRVMTVIEDIADQTNLLALNAAIEAARAGDAGRGFAVVADEVRKLAEKTMNATKEVGEAIATIQSGTRTNIQGMEQAAEAVGSATRLVHASGEALREIVTMVEAAADQVRSIATAAEEQSATSEEINHSVDDINRIAAETSQVMEQSALAVSELARQAGELRELVLRMKSA